MQTNRFNVPANVSEPLPVELEPYRVYSSRTDHPDGTYIEHVVYKLRDNLAAVFIKRPDVRKRKDGVKEPTEFKMLGLMAWTGRGWVPMARRYTRTKRDLRDLATDFWGQRDPNYRPEPLKEFPEDFRNVYF